MSESEHHPQEATTNKNTEETASKPKVRRVIDENRNSLFKAPVRTRLIEFPVHDMVINNSRLYCVGGGGREKTGIKNGICIVSSDLTATALQYTEDSIRTALFHKRTFVCTTDEEVLLYFLDGRRLFLNKRIAYDGVKAITIHQNTLFVLTNSELYRVKLKGFQSTLVKKLEASHIDGDYYVEDKRLRRISNDSVVAEIKGETTKLVVDGQKVYVVTIVNRRITMLTTISNGTTRTKRISIYPATAFGTHNGYELFGFADGRVSVYYNGDHLKDYALHKFPVCSIVICTGRLYSVSLDGELKLTHVNRNRIVLVNNIRKLIVFLLISCITSVLVFRYMKAK